MPIKPVAPRPGKTPYWSGRGTHFGQYVDRSTKARQRSIAVKIIRKWEDEIERGAYATPGDPTFASEALAYMKAGGERRFLAPIISHFADAPIRGIGQSELDAGAAQLYPNATPATQNRNYYSPAIAVLHRAGVAVQFKRPLGAAGRQINSWLWPEQARALIQEAAALDLEFGIFLVLLYATGMRLTEALRTEIDRLRIRERYLHIPDSKNGTGRAIYLPKQAVDALRMHPRGLNRPGARIFKFRKGGRIYSLLRGAGAKAGVPLPPRAKFHIFCHTYATLMRRYGKLDLRGLLGTDRWKDIKSTMRYAHAVASEESQRADFLPAVGLKRARGKIR
jgi:integrase